MLFPQGLRMGKLRKEGLGMLGGVGDRARGSFLLPGRAITFHKKTLGVTKSTARFSFPDAGAQFSLPKAVLTVGPRLGTQEALLKQMVLGDHQGFLKEIELCRVYSGLIGRNLPRHLRQNGWGEAADIQGLPGLNMLSHPPQPELCLWEHPAGSGEPTPCQATWQCWGAVFLLMRSSEPFLTEIRWR